MYSSGVRFSPSLVVVLRRNTLGFMSLIARQDMFIIFSLWCSRVFCFYPFPKLYLYSAGMNVILHDFEIVTIIVCINNAALIEVCMASTFVVFSFPPLCISSLLLWGEMLVFLVCCGLSTFLGRVLAGGIGTFSPFLLLFLISVFIVQVHVYT